MGYAARVMRGLIIDTRGAGTPPSAAASSRSPRSDTDLAESIVDDEALSEIGDALDELAEADPVLAEIVDLKFFCGFSFAEIAAMHGTSERTDPAPVGEGAHLPAPDAPDDPSSS